MIYDNSEVRKKIEKIVDKWKNLWKKKSFTIFVSKSVFMLISLKSNWAEKIKTYRIYFFDLQNRIFVNEIFDKLHNENKMRWSKQSIFFEYPVFVIWKIVIKNEKSIRKNRIVIDIRELNEIIQIDVYSMSIQANIITTVIDCTHIFIVDAQGYFYQWTVKKKNRYKQTIIFHRKQKKFNVTIMNFKNSSAYVQKPTTFILKNSRKFVRIYIDDIVIFFKSLNDHVKHLNLTFKNSRNTTWF